MKEEEINELFAGEKPQMVPQFDRIEANLAAWWAEQPLKTFRVTLKDGDVVVLKAHTTSIDQHTLRVVKYELITLPAVVGNSVENVKTSIAILVGAFHAGEWQKFVDKEYWDDIDKTE